MFNCDLCKMPTGPRVSPTFVVVETRHKDYYEQRGDEQVLIGHGFETVKEVKICPNCVAAKLQ